MAPKKKTSAAGSKVSVKALLEAIGDEQDIRAVTNTISSVLQLDLSQRSGLRDVHKSCGDKLVAEGTLAHLARLLDNPACVLVALKALAIIACHGGEAERLAVAKSTSGAVLSLAARVDETDPLFARCITVLSHSCMLLPEKRKAAGINDAALLEVCVKACRALDDSTATHGFQAVAKLVEGGKMSKVVPAVLSCLVGHLRHPESWQRAEAYMALQTLAAPESQLESMSFDKSTKAAVIECKLLLATRKYVQGHQAAEKYLAVDPDWAYMYYILAMGNPDPTAGFKWAKKGIVSGPQGYMQRNLLQASTDYATTLARNVLNGNIVGICDRSQMHAVVAAFLRSAAADAESYTRTSAPDSRALRMMFYKSFCLDLYVRGKGVGRDLRKEFARTLEQLRRVEHLRQRIFGPPVVVQNQVVWETVLRVYAKAAEEWDKVFVATGAGGGAREEVDDDGVEELMKSLCCGEKPEGGGDEHRRLRDTLDEESVALLACSTCQNLSVALKKCSACGRARYCDTRCSRKGWKAHKKACQEFTKAKAAQQ